MRTQLRRRQDQNIDKKVMTTQEAARYLDVKFCTMMNIIASGELPYRKVGRVRLFTKATLDAWLRFDPTISGK